MFRAIVESARDCAIFMLDPEGCVVTWNAGAERVEGYAAADILGHHVSAFFPPGVEPAVIEAQLSAALRDGRFEIEDWRVRRDGSRFWADVVIVPLHDPVTGAHVGFSEITRDLTERRKAEGLRVELAHTQEALRLRDDFLAIAAHELRTPLVALQLQLETLRLDDVVLDAKQRSKLDRAARNVHRLADLITTLLDVSRVSAGRLSLAPERVELGELAREVVDRLHEPAIAARCEVALTVGEDVVGTWDPLRVGQVLSNVLANAFKYAAGSRIDVAIARDGDGAVIRVEDRGPGIDAARLGHVFARFERASTARSFGGMGLGLYLAREIVAAHGGSIHASNRLGGGLAIDVRLPTDVPTGEVT